MFLEENNMKSPQTLEHFLQQTCPSFLFNQYEHMDYNAVQCNHGNIPKKRSSVRKTLPQFSIICMTHTKQPFKSFICALMCNVVVNE